MTTGNFLPASLSAALDKLLHFAPGRAVTNRHHLDVVYLSAATDPSGTARLTTTGMRINGGMVEKASGFIDCCQFRPVSVNQDQPRAPGGSRPEQPEAGCGVSGKTPGSPLRLRSVWPAGVIQLDGRRNEPRIGITDHRNQLTLATRRIPGTSNCARRPRIHPRELRSANAEILSFRPRRMASMRWTGSV